jgi:hypothetical protein
MAFAKLKAHLRKAAERSIPALWDRIGSILDLFSPRECLNFFNHAGYAQSQSKMALIKDLNGRHQPAATALVGRG